MNRFITLLEEYLAFRRACGYGLVRAEKLLRQYDQWLDMQPEPGGGELFTKEQALTWASLPGGSVTWQTFRLGVTRGFALWLDSQDVLVGVPSPKMLPRAGRRAIPYQYSNDDIAALMAVCHEVFTPFRAATMATLIGFLTVTGCRIGEAIGLDINDIDLVDGQVLIRHGKNSKERFVFLKPSSCRAIAAYLATPTRPRPASPALFLSLAGTRLLYCNVSEGFIRMIRACDLTHQPGAHPRLHDLRHRFATDTIAAAYAPGAIESPARTLTLLSTWLGHVDPSNTYWYLEASPQLLALATAKLDQADQELS